MFRSSKSSESLDIAEVFYSQSEYIRNKRSVRISLQDFPPTATLASVCDTLVMILGQHNPPIHLEKIFASDNQIQQLPQEFLQLCGPNLRTLDLHRNHLTRVPENLARRCPNLEMLDLSGNAIAHISDEALSPLRNLKLLSLKDNRITHLPPILGEMISLENLSLSGNPLMFPTLDMVNSMPGGINDLKAFLVSNGSFDPRAEPQDDPKSDPKFDFRADALKQIPPSTPGLIRTRSLSDTRSRSSKASRRMGLIINSQKVTPDKSALTSGNDASTPSKPARKLSLPNREKIDMADFAVDGREPKFPDLAPIPSTYTESTAETHTFSASSPKSASTSNFFNSAFTGNSSGLKNTTSREIEHNLDDLADVDQRPVAYFRRLSVLPETPLDDTQKAETGSGDEGSRGTTSQQSEASPTKPQPARKASNSQQVNYQNVQNSQNGQNVQNSQTANGQGAQNGSNVLNVQSAQNAQTQTLQHPQNPQSSQTGRGSVHEKSVIVKVSRKILFSFSELHLSIKRFAGFCGDRRLSSKIVRLIHSSKEHIDDLVEAMEAVEDGEENHTLVVNSLHGCISSFKTILATISENFSTLVAKIDACFIRMVLLTLFGSLNELQNAHKLLVQSNPVKTHGSLTRNPSSLGLSFEPRVKYTQPGHVVSDDISLETPSISSATEAVATLEEIDERLYQTISLATDNAQVVFSELTKTISKSAMATVNKNSPGISPAVAAKFKELTHVCMTSMDITKRLVGKLAAIRQNQDSATRRSFWDDINLFLKAVIQTFSSVKDIMKDAPIFNEVRRSMANLTKTTKELTIILEASSYKSISDAVGSPPNNHMWHMSNGPPASASGIPGSAAPQMPANAGSIPPVRTPLVATVGTAAAQALLPQQDTQYSVNAHTSHNHANPQLPPLNLPPSVATDASSTGLHTAPVQSMEQYYAKNVNPFDRM